MRWLGAIVVVLTGLAAAWQSADRWAPLPQQPVISRIVTDRDGLPLRVFPVEDGRWRMAADLDDIDPRFIEALLLIEDKRFFEHRGVDPVALLRAARDNLLRGEVVSGASTITMQTVRLLEPRPRTLPSKLIEILRARQLERVLTKSEILEVYLTLTPYGGNIEGVRSAAWTYFGKDARALTDAEIALLVALPQSPEVRRPDRRAENARSARGAVLERLASEDFLSTARAREAHLDPLPATRTPFPSDAWHFAESVGGAMDRSGTVRTSLDRPAQEALVRVLHEAAERYGTDTQAAGLIVDLETRQILASVGSVGRDRPGGWLDLTQRKRSPGSTLKPFVYGLAFQEGVVSPGSRIADLPSRFGAYQPENFSRTFNGDLSVAEALQHSLNVPAVLLLDQLGAERFAGILRLSGARVDIPEVAGSSEGLATALGGLGLSARELAALYVALGNGGLALPLSEDLRPLPNEPARLMTEEAAQKVADILRRAPASLGRMPSHLATNAPQVSFKTGTSYGYRDAWAAGFSGTHAVVVWIGRADGGALPGMTGRDAALPALFSVFDRIEAPAQVRTAQAFTREPTQRRLAAQDGPSLLFPTQGATLWPKRGEAPFLLAARSASPVRWYINGALVTPDPDGNIAWRPEGPGFYDVTVVDEEGREDRASFRVQSSRT